MIQNIVNILVKNTKINNGRKFLIIWNNLLNKIKENLPDKYKKKYNYVIGWILKLKIIKMKMNQVFFFKIINLEKIGKSL